MRKQDGLKLSTLQSKILNISKHLGYLSEKEIRVYFSFELDIPNQCLILETVEIGYYVNTKENEALDYLTIKELRDLTVGLPVTFRGFDTSVETKWDYYNDCMEEGSLLEEYWQEDEQDSHKLKVMLEIEDAETFKNYLTDKKLTDTFYIEGNMSNSAINIELSKSELMNKKRPYLEQPDVVNVLKSLLYLDTENKYNLNEIAVKEKVNKGNIEDINKEFIENIHVLQTHEKFQNLVKDYTVEELDECYLYINTYKKVATLTRYFKGAYYVVNTVYNLPLTLSTKYQVEDLGDFISTATEDWDTSNLNGRYSRILHKEEDYHKFATFIRKHFPSLLRESGELKTFEMNVRLGDLKPERVSGTTGYRGFTVLGEDLNGVVIKPHQTLAIVAVSYDEQTKPKSTDGEAFINDYQQFINWLMANKK